MPALKSRWSKVYESSEEELIDLLEALGVTADRLEFEAFHTIEPRHHDNDTRLWCAEGSAVFTVDSKSISMQPGDTLAIPSGTTYEAEAGISGCVYYQA
jgi:mannose-6-phosphate isomerase-like protein (cupin superfamily)